MIGGGAAFGPTAEIFDPTATTVPAFTATSGRLHHLRTGHTATRLAVGPNAGKVLIAVGSGNATGLFTNGVLQTRPGPRRRRRRQRLGS